MKRQFVNALITRTVVISLLVASTQIVVSPAEAWFGKSSCQKTKDSIIAEDKVYVVLLSTAIKDAKIYQRSKSSSDATNGQDASITVLQAEITEYKLAVGNPKCFSASQLATFRLNITSDETIVTQTQAFIADGGSDWNVSGIVKLKPESLLKIIYG